MKPQFVEMELEQFLYAAPQTQKQLIDHRNWSGKLNLSEQDKEIFDLNLAAQRKFFVLQAAGSNEIEIVRVLFPDMGEWFDIHERKRGAQ